MGLQDKISAARAALLRQYEEKCGEHIEEQESILNDEIMALVIDLDLALA